MKKSDKISCFLIIILILICVFCSRQAKNSEDEQSVQNLKAFGKLYGYIKYFHPSDEAARIDWDRFAVYGVGKVLQAKDGMELKNVLKELFLPIAPTVQIFRTDEEMNKPFSELPEDMTGLEVVAWQHRGVWLDSFNSPYRSVRLNRKNVFYAQGRGLVYQELEAVKLRGKSVKLMAGARTDIKERENQSSLFLQVWGESGLLEGKRSPISPEPDDWDKYEVEILIPEYAHKIRIGVHAGKSGGICVDDFRLFVSTENNDWEQIPVANPGFEEGNLNRIASHWKTQARGFTTYVKNKGAYRGQNCLYIQRKSQEIKDGLFEDLPEFGELIEKEIGSDLRCRIPLALYSKEEKTVGQNDEYPFHRLASELDMLESDYSDAENGNARIAGD